MILFWNLPDSEENIKLEKIYKRYKQELYYTAYKILGTHDVAEDIVQNAFLRVNDHLGKISDVECKKTKAYLVTIVKNLCYDYYKKDNVKGINVMSYAPVDELIDIEDAKTQTENIILNKECQIEFQALLKLLKPEYSEIIRLYYYDDLSHQEIGALLHITNNNVGVRLNRAVHALHKLYQQE